MKSVCLFTMISACLVTAFFFHAGKPSVVNAAGSQPAAFEESTATDFYRGVGAGIGSAKGELHFKLLPGTTISNINNTVDIRWVVQSETDVRVKLDFPDATQGWKSLTMDFSDPIVAFFRQGRADAVPPQQITRIEFRRNGEPLEYFNQFRQPIGLALSRFPEIRRHLKIPNGPSSLFLGLPFAGIPQQSAAGGLVVKEVVVLQPAEPANATNVTLLPQTTLNFSANPLHPSFKTSIRLRAQSSLNITSLSYRPDGSRTIGALGPVSFNVTEAHLEVPNTLLVLDSGGTLTFNVVNFSSIADGGSPGSVSALGGSMQGRMKAGSKIEVSRTDRGPAQFGIRPSDPSIFQNLNLISTDAPSFAIELGTATLPIAGTQGEVAFDTKNFFILRFPESPSLAINVGKSLWHSDRPPIFTGGVPAFSAAVSGGQVMLNDQSELRMISGQVESTGVIIDTNAPRNIRGSFMTATFVLAPGSTLGVKDHLSTVAAGGTLNAASSTNPLTFDPDKKGPSGRFVIAGFSVQEGSLRLGNQGSIQLSSGLLNAALTRTPESGVSGKLSGNLTSGVGLIELDSNNAYPINNGTLAFNDLSLSDSEGLTGAIRSVRFSLQPSLVSFSDKLTAATLPGGTFIAENQSSPFTLNPNGDLTGKTALHFQIQQGLLLMGGVFIVPLQGGTIDAQTTIVGTRPLGGTIALDGTSNTGTFELNETTTLHVTNGHVKANQLTFQNPDVLTGDFDLVEFQFAESTLTLPNSLFTGFSSATLDANGGPLTINIGPGGRVYGSYHLHLVVATGEMTLGDVGKIQLTGGTVDLYWSRKMGQSESITANADVIIGSGNIEPIQGTHIALQSASRLKATGLSVSDADGITGALTEVDLILGAATVVIPDGSTLETKSGGHLTASQTTSLTVPQTGSFLQGGFVLDVPFFSFSNYNDPTFKLKDGRAILPLHNVSDGSIIGSNCNIQGDLLITVKDAEGSIDIAIDVELSDGVLTRQVGKPTRLSGKLRVRIPSGLSIPKTIPQEDHGGNKHQFKVNLKILTASDLTFTSLIILNGKNVELCDMPAQTAHLKIEVLEGNGEHPNGNFDQTNGNMSPNQEVFTDTICSPFTCRIHIYLKPHSYSTSASLKIGLNNGKPVIEIGGLHLNESVQWDRDGCGASPCVAVALLWRFFTGQDSPDEFVNRKVQEMVSKFHYTLKN